MFSNRKRFHDFIEQIRVELKLRLYDYELNEDDDSILIFRIKELDNWLFGAWITDTEKYHEDDGQNFYITVFCQPIDFVDKFKPSRGWFSIDVYAEVKEGKLEYGLWELDNYLNFMIKHEAIFFCCEDDITYTYEKPLWKYKRIMKKEIKQERKIKENRRKQRIKNIKLLKILSTFNFISLGFRPDDLNWDNNIIDSRHINDAWYAYPHNKIGNFFLKRIKKSFGKYFLDGYLTISDNRLDWLLDCLESYIPEDKRAEMIAADIEQEIKELEEDEKAMEDIQNNKLYIWDDNVMFKNKVLLIDFCNNLLYNYYRKEKERR